MRPTSARPGAGGLKRLSAMEAIIVLTTGGSFIRLIWCIIVVNGRTATSMLLSPSYESVFLKGPQIFWIAAFFYTALVWERLSQQASSLQTRKEGKKASATGPLTKGGGAQFASAASGEQPCFSNALF